MKKAVSVSLGSHTRDRETVIHLGNQDIHVRRMGTDGDAERSRQLFLDLDGQVDALGVGGVDLYIRVGAREYPLRAALKLVEGVHRTPVVDGRGLKHTLERRVIELAAPTIGQVPHYRRAFMPMAIDRLGMAQAVSEITDEIIIGDFMVALGLPVPVRGLDRFYRVARLMMPLVSHFPMSMLYYGSSGAEQEPKYQRYWKDADLIAGDFLFMRKYLPDDLEGKTVITNTTTGDNIDLLRSRGVNRIITTTPRYGDRSYGTNMMEATLTAYAGKGRPLSSAELNGLIDELEFRPTVHAWID
ncbi:MAG: quinate 5-dehydrogenase [Chloroflexi bacterium]|nr:quinate 5-dehydrogenase [Chloroflexota bacterium]